MGLCQGAPQPGAAGRGSLRGPAAHCWPTGVEGLSLDVSCLVDIRDHVNKELALRFSTDIESEDTFFTDLNGFQVCQQPGEGRQLPAGAVLCPQPLTPVPRQIQPRRYQQKLPLQANFYPMPAMAYIQDMQSRLTLHTAQALGVSSLSSGEPGPGAVPLGGSGGCWQLLTPGARGPLSAGQLEVILDRRLMQDDNRGLGQGLKDNKRTCNRFRLLLERRATANKVRGLGAPRDFGGQGQRCCGAEPSPASGCCGTVVHTEPGVQPDAGCPPCTSRPSRPPRWHRRGTGPCPERGVWGGQDCVAGSAPRVGARSPCNHRVLIPSLVALDPRTISPTQSSSFFSKLASVFKALGFPGARTGSPEVTAGPALPPPVSCSSC